MYLRLISVLKFENQPIVCMLCFAELPAAFSVFLLVVLNVSIFHCLAYVKPYLRIFPILWIIQYSIHWISTLDLPLNGKRSIALCVLMFANTGSTIAKRLEYILRPLSVSSFSAMAFVRLPATLPTGTLKYLRLAFFRLIQLTFNSQAFQSSFSAAYLL